MNKRPPAVTLLSLVLGLTGAAGLISHFSDFRTQPPFQYDIVGIAAVRFLAVAAGLFLLWGLNWARWLALAWVAFHVIVGAFHSWFQLAVHSLLCAIFAFFLFRGEADRYFRAKPSGE